MSWFLRGVQSAIFYYASCAPLHQYKHKRRRKRENRADRQAREKYENDTPDMMLYRQPSPQATNEFWADEIRIGPGPPPKRAKKLTKRQKELDRLAAESRAEEKLPDIHLIDEDGHDASAAVDGSGGTTADSTTSLRDPPNAKWNTHRFYQRQDEELWGIEFSSIDTSSSSAAAIPMPAPAHHQPFNSTSKTRPHASSAASTTASTAASARISARDNIIARAITQATVGPGTSSNESIYAAPRAPPLNDNHPPVARNPLHSKRTLTRWMLQPTPAPSVMDGRTQVRTGGGSGSGSGSSRQSVRRYGNANANGSASVLGRNKSGRSVRTEQTMRRQISHRMLAEKLAAGESVDDVGAGVRHSRAERRQQNDSADSNATVIHRRHSLSSSRSSLADYTNANASSQATTREAGSSNHKPDSGISVPAIVTSENSTPSAALATGSIKGPNPSSPRTATRDFAAPTITKAKSKPLPFRAYNSNATPRARPQNDHDYDDMYHYDNEIDHDDYDDHDEYEDDDNNDPIYDRDFSMPKAGVRGRAKTRIEGRGDARGGPMVEEERIGMDMDMLGRRWSL